MELGADRGSNLFPKRDEDPLDLALGYPVARGESLIGRGFGCEVVILVDPEGRRAGVPLPDAGVGGIDELVSPGAVEDLLRRRRLGVGEKIRQLRECAFEREEADAASPLERAQGFLLPGDELPEHELEEASEAAF